ncbi:hypothetical protein DFH29DRAFT_196622 [Suillus ampliporus]|nr:hypothetical protein DFH29DRAFT_196622 [Suillus ampliporus]
MIDLPVTGVIDELVISARSIVCTTFADMSASPRPSSKRIKLESESPSPRLENGPSTLTDEDLGDDHCVICLQPLVDRTVIPTCSHEFCFECISIWAEQSLKCPLCSRLLGEYLIHHIRSQFDYQKHYLPPPRSSSPQLLPTGETHVQVARRARRDRYWGRRYRQDADELERAVDKRRWVYQNHLYAKHVASNSFTRYRPYPSPAQFAASPDMISRATIFLRRELRVWPNLDVEFLTTFTISLMKSIDMRAESSVKLLAEFLDLDTPYIEGQRHPNAEHFAHEIYCYIRSGRDLSIYDTLVQYDTSPDPPLHDGQQERENRWRYESRSRSRSPHHRHHRSQSRSPISRPPSSTLRPEQRRSPSSIYRGENSPDYLSSNRRHRRGTRSPASERRDIPDTSNDQQSYLNDTQERLVHKSEKAKGKEPERNHTPLRGHHSSSTPPCISGEFAPNAVVESHQTAESHTSGNEKLRTPPPVESSSKDSLVAPASGAPAHVPLGVDIDPEPTSRKRPSTLGRPPRNRTLLASVQAHLSQRTTSRPTKHLTDTTARKTEAAQYLHHPSQPPRDARDGGGALLSQLSSSLANAPPPSLSSLGQRSDTSTPLGGENPSAVGNQIRKKVRSLPADPITKSTDEENAFAGGKSMSCPCSTSKEGTDKNINKEDHPNATSPSPRVLGVHHTPRAPNPIPSPHNSNHDHGDFLRDVAEHTRRGNEEDATYAHGITTPSVRASTDMRAVLLERLEEEQRLASISTSSHSALSSTVVPPSGEEASALVLETRLRTRALLRVRLAAIKNTANTALVES